MLKKTLGFLFLGVWAYADTGYVPSFIRASAVVYGTTITVSGGGYSTIQDEGSDLTTRTTVNFTGAGVSCADNAGSTRTDCTITSGGGGSSSLQVTRSGVQITSPTASINFYSGDFLGTAIAGTTSYIFLNPGTTNYIRNTASLQTGTTFYTSSGTVNTFNIGTQIRWPDGTIQISSPTSGGSGDMVLASTQTVTGRKVFQSSTTFSGAVYISSSILLSDSVGSDGQVLTSAGPGAVPTWETPATGGGGASTLAVFEDTVNVSSPTAIIKFDGGPFNVTLPASGTGYIQLDPSSVTLQGQNVINLGSTLQSGAVFHVSSGSVNTLNITDAGYIKSLSPSTTATIDLTLGDLNQGLVIKTGEATAAGIPYIQLNESMIKMKQAVVGPAAYSNFQMCNGTNCNYLYSVDPSYSSPPPGWYFNNSPAGAYGMYVGASSTTIKAPYISLNGYTKLTSSMSITGANGLTLTYGIAAATAAFTTDVLVNSQSVCLEDGTNCPAGGAGDMILASTQTVTGRKVFQSSTTFSGGLYISSTVLVNASPGSSGQILTSGGNGALPSWASNTATVGISYDGSGSALTSGSTRYITIPYAATIIGWTLTSDTTGSMQIDVKKCSGYDCNPTTSIAGTEKPLLSSTWSNQDLSLGSWTTSVASDDKLAFVLDSASTLTAATLVIHLNKN